MQEIANSRLSITVEQVASSWHHSGTKAPSSRIMALLSDLLAQVEAERWIQPNMSFRIWPIAGRGQGWLELSGGPRISSCTLGHHLPGATHLATGVCTIGDAIEKHVSTRFAARDRLGAVMLDEIGTLALFRVSSQLEELMQAEAAQRQLESSGVLSPGEDGFEISHQAAVLELADGGKIGVSQTSTGMLVPRKSLSMALGFGTRMPKWSRGEICARCKSRDRCPHRRQNGSEVVR